MLSSNQPAATARPAALITGASSGIGAALARELARRGFNLVLCARRVDRLNSLQQELTEFGVTTLPVSCDVRQQADLERAVGIALNTFGTLHVVIANAGFAVTGYFKNLTNQDFENQFSTNVFGVLNTARAAQEALFASRGTFALMGSVNSYLSLPGSAPYSMSKFAIKAFADSLYLEWAPRGVGVTLFCPGFVESEIRQVDNSGQRRSQSKDPIPRIFCLSAAKAAVAMVDAVLARRREVVVTGHGKVLVRMMRYFPSLYFLIGRVFHRQFAKQVAVFEGAKNA